MTLQSDGGGWWVVGRRLETRIGGGLGSSLYLKLQPNKTTRQSRKGRVTVTRRVKRYLSIDESLSRLPRYFVLRRRGHWCPIHCCFRWTIDSGCSTFNMAVILKTAHNYLFHSYYLLTLISKKLKIPCPIDISATENV